MFLRELTSNEICYIRGENTSETNDDRFLRMNDLYNHFTKKLAEIIATDKEVVKIDCTKIFIADSITVNSLLFYVRELTGYYPSSIGLDIYEFVSYDLQVQPSNELGQIIINIAGSRPKYRLKTLRESETNNR
jgi:hypothetical protein